MVVALQLTQSIAIASCDLLFGKPSWLAELCGPFPDCDYICKSWHCIAIALRKSRPSSVALASRQSIFLAFASSRASSFSLLRVCGVHCTCLYASSRVALPSLRYAEVLCGCSLELAACHERFRSSQVMHRNRFLRLRKTKHRGRFSRASQSHRDCYGNSRKCIAIAFANRYVPLRSHFAIHGSHRGRFSRSRGVVAIAFRNRSRFIVDAFAGAQHHRNRICDLRNPSRLHLETCGIHRACFSARL